MVKIRRLSTLYCKKMSNSSLLVKNHEHNSTYFVLYKNLSESLGHALRSVNLQLVTFWLLQERKKKSTIQGVKWPGYKRCHPLMTMNCFNSIFTKKNWFCIKLLHQLSEFSLKKKMLTNEFCNKVWQTSIVLDQEFSNRSLVCTQRV